MLDILYSVIVLFALLLIFVCLLYEKKGHISPTPSLPAIRQKAIAMLAEITDRKGVYNIADLGSGWGGMLMKLARAYPCSRVTGYEISPFPFLFSRVVSLFFLNRMNVSQQDFWSRDWAGFDIIFCYLSRYHMDRLKENASKLQSGAIIISCSFPIEGWEPKRMESVPVFGMQIPIFLYVYSPS